MCIFQSEHPSKTVNFNLLMAFKFDLMYQVKNLMLIF